MEENYIKNRERPEKTIRETIMKDLDVNEFDSNAIYDIT